MRRKRDGDLTRRKMYGMEMYRLHTLCYDPEDISIVVGGRDHVKPLVLQYQCDRVLAIDAARCPTSHKKGGERGT